MKLSHLTSSVALTLFVFLIAACSGGKDIVGSGVLIDDQRALTSFNEVVLDANIDVDIDYGSMQQVNVYGQGQVLPVISTEVKGEKLTISMSQKAQMDGATNIKIMLPELVAVTNTGAGNLRFDGFKGDKLKLMLQGPGNLTGTDLTYDDIKLTNDGAGNLMLSGNSDDLEALLDGPGDVDARRLMVKDAKLTNKGAGNISASVQNDLKADIKGVGDIIYKGDPKVDLTDDGAGSLKGDN